MEKKNNFFDKNNFVYFTLKKSITTQLDDGIEKKRLPFPKKELFSWKEVNKDNYKNYVNDNDKTFIIITGEMSNITVIDFDKNDIYEKIIEEFPELKSFFTVKTNKGYHIYCNYNKALQTTTDVNKLDNGIDIRNDKGLIIAPPTEYKLLNGTIAKYTFLGGTIQDIPLKVLEKLSPKQKEKEKKEKKTKEQKNKEKEEFNNDIKKKEIKKLLKLLKENRSSKYTDWINVGIIIWNELNEDGLKIFHKFSKLCPDKYDEDECNYKFDSFKSETENKLTIGTLKMMAKEDSPEEYAELYKNDDAIKSTFTMLEKDIAEYIINNLLDNNFICHQLKPPEFHYFNGNCWVHDGGNQKLLIIIYNDLIKQYESLFLETSDDQEKEIIKKLIKKLKGKLPFIHSIIDWIALLTFNIKFFEIIDENPDLIAFSDGVYEINNKLFRKGCREDYITKTTGYNFPIDDDYGHKKDIEDFLMKVFPNEKVRNFVIQTQAQALSGRKTEDLVYTHTGRGGNGKSILIEILKNVFGKYFVNIPVAMLTKANNKGHNDPDPYMQELKGIRYAMSNEPKDGASFNDQLIKNLGSQEPLKYRLLYSNTPVNLNIQLKLNIYCNNKLKFNGEDEGIGRRMCVIDYISRFTKDEDVENNVYLIDTELTDKVKNWKQDYMKLLIGLHQNEYKHTPPKEILEASKCYINENNDVYKFVNDNFERTGNNKDFILLKDIKLMYQNNKEYEQTKLKTLKSSLEKIFNSNFIDDKKINGKKYTSVMMGWRLKLDNDEDDKFYDI